VERRRGAAIILAGSGFCDAGPILHHLAGAIEEPTTEVVLAGHQIDGTLGHGLAADAKRIQIGNAILEVRATRTKLELLSGHADQSELLAWARSLRPSPTMFVLNHGTQRARAVIAELLSAEANASVRLPMPAETVAT